MNDRLQYDRLMDDALRGIVRRVLVDVAKKGLPGAHHFYISFRTAADGVELPEYLRSKYPDEMTIVLQHQYWGLEVGEDTFEVTVSFNKMNERLKVPFDAMTAFVDPSVRFGLQFRKPGDEAAADKEKKPDGATALPAAAPRPQLAGPGAGAPEREAKPAEKAPAKAEAAPADGGDKPAPEPPKGGKIVALDAFRKK